MGGSRAVFHLLSGFGREQKHAIFRMIYLQVLANGVVLGGLYAAIAVGILAGLGCA